MPLHLRPACPTDARFAAPLIQEAIGAIGQHLTGTHSDEAAAHTIARFFGEAGHRLSFQQVLIAEDSEGAVGLALAYDGAQAQALDEFWRSYRASLGLSPTVTSEAQPGEYYLDTLATVPAARGRGIGTALIAACGQQAQALGLPLTLLVEENNPARRLYERCGLQPWQEQELAGHRYTRMIGRP